MAKPRQHEGDALGRFRARRLMKQAGVAVKLAKHDTVTTDSRPAHPVAPHLVARQLAVEQPHHVWAGDMTSLWTAEGWVSLAVRWDVSSRQVVGWAMSSRLSANVVREAWGMALGRRRPAAGLMHHADRGSQDACHEYQCRLAAHERRARMSRQGDGWDHAVVERCFGSLKRERTAHRQYAPRQEARDDVMDDMEMFDNRKRLHAYLGSVSPNAYESCALVASLGVYFCLTTTHLASRFDVGAPSRNGVCSTGQWQARAEGYE